MSRKLFHASCILMVLLFAVLAVSRYIGSREIEALMNGSGNEEVYRLATSVCTFLLNALNACLFVWPFFALPLWLSGKENIAASLWDIAKTSSVGIIFAVALYFARLSFIGSGNIQRVITNGLTCLLVGLFVSLGLAAVISRRRQGKRIISGDRKLISFIFPTLTILSCADYSSDLVRASCRDIASYTDGHCQRDCISYSGCDRPSHIHNRRRACCSSWTDRRLSHRHASICCDRRFAYEGACVEASSCCCSIIGLGNSSCLCCGDSLACICYGYRDCPGSCIRIPSFCDRRYTENNSHCDNHTISEDQGRRDARVR